MCVSSSDGEESRPQDVMVVLGRKRSLGHRMAW